MTKAERRQLRYCIGELIRDNGDFSGALGELAKLAGMVYPAAAVMREARAVDLRKIASRRVSQFSVAPTTPSR